MRQLIMIVGLSLLLMAALIAYGVSNFDWLDMTRGIIVLVAAIIILIASGVNYRTVTPITDEELRNTGYISLICFLSSIGAYGLIVIAFNRDGKEAGSLIAVVFLLMIPVIFYGMVTLLAWIIAYLRKLIFNV